MSGLLALVGAGEYLETMEAVDRRLLAEVGRARAKPPVVVCIPAAAGAEGEASVERWAQQGVRHFTRLGAAAQAARVVDRASADDPRWAALIAAADLIYFSGGDPLYLYRALAGSRAWDAVAAAQARGAVLAGCSAGAMILGRQVPDVAAPELALHSAFGALSASLILPHFDQLETFRPGLTATVQASLDEGEYALGIDEHTALVGRPGEAWEVLGAGTAALLTRGDRRVFPAGSRVTLPGPA